MKTWKSVSSRRIATEAKINQPIWQEDYFDHFVRSASAYEEKWEYVRQNPCEEDFVSALRTGLIRASCTILRFG